MPTMIQDLTRYLKFVKSQVDANLKNLESISKALIGEFCLQVANRVYNRELSINYTNWGDWASFVKTGDESKG
jgi:hypothetical protein